MDKAIEIFEKHIGLNAELDYLPIKRKDVLDAINEALNTSNENNSSILTEGKTKSNVKKNIRKYKISPKLPPIKKNEQS